MALQPTGTVTLLFTDIEGSTRLLERLGRERYAEALEIHRLLLRGAFEAHDGYVVDCEGDAFFAAFPRADDAVAAAFEAQQALAAAVWPEGEELRVRMGLHTGEPLTVRPKYVGLDVHRAARVMAAGHGGQVLLSQTTRDLVGDGVAVRDLGEHRLKDLSLPQRLYQLQVEGLRSDFPALKTLENRPTNLPVQPTPLIGRERELGGLAALLLEDDVRLVTLTGVGGTGKTRLALHAAADLIERFDNGVFFVSLAPIVDAALVIPTIAQTLGLREQAGQALADTVGEYLRDKVVLLLVDNFEHVVEAAPAIAALLSLAPALRVLATSRMPLRLAGEHLYAVPPLGLPGADSRADLEVLTQFEAVRLFISRARAARADFVVTAENAPAVAEVCVRVDGLPLAIELAAARIRVLSPQSMLSRLDERLKLLTGGGRDRDLRQQTLHATIAWSFDLLPAEEKTLFARLSVFADGCRIDAAEAVCIAGGDPGIDVFEGLASLVEKSLLRQRDDADAAPRFWMLETIREYAREQLRASGEENLLRERHAAWALAFAAEPTQGRDGSEVFSRLNEEQANLRAALDWAANARPQTLLALSMTLAGFWIEFGWLDDAEQWLVPALAWESEPTFARATLLRYVFWLRLQRGDLASARTLATERQEVAEILDDTSMRVGALSARSAVAMHEGDYLRGHALQAEAVELARTVGGETLVASLINLGNAAERLGDFTTAQSAAEEAIALAREIGDSRDVAHIQQNLAWLSLLQDRLDDAERYWRLAVPVLRQGRNATGLRYAVDGLAAMAALRGDSRRATALAAATARDWTDHGEVPDKFHQEEIDRYTALMREQLSPDEFAQVWTEGEKLSLDDAASLGLDGTIPT